MKIATSFTDKFYDEFKNEHNQVVKDQFKLAENFGKQVKQFSFEEELEDSLDINESKPVFSFEISKNETKTGVPHEITFEGLDYFEWEEV